MNPGMADYGDPTSYMALNKGTPVYASDGNEVGRVERVLAVDEKDIFDGIAIDTSHGKRFVDAPEVDRIYENGVVLNIDSAQAAELPPPDANY